MVAIQSFVEKSGGGGKLEVAYRTPLCSLYRKVALDISSLLLKSVYIFFFSQPNALCLKLLVLFLLTVRVSPRNDLIESPPLQSSSSQIADVSQSGSVSLLVYSAADGRKEMDSGNSSNH